ncbi:MAG TPA: transglutaminase-like domain-containing protein [Polyangiaceae bacterium]|jgi:hypothetical protein
MPADAFVLRETEALDFLVYQGWAYEALEGCAALTNARRLASDTLERLRAEGMAFGDGAGGPRYDPVALMDAVTDLGLRGRDPTFLGAIVPKGRRMVDESAARLARAPGGVRGFDVEFRREIPEERRASLRRVTLPLPLEDQQQRIGALSVESPRDTAIVRREGRLSFTGRGLAGAGALVVAARFRLEVGGCEVSRPEPAGSGVDPMELRRREGLVVVTPRIHETARRWTSGATTHVERIARIWDELLARIRVQRIHYDALPQDDPLGSILDDGKCDCQSDSALLVAMCRSLGIPARIVGGYNLYPVAVTPHYWFEAMLEDGIWRPFDHAVSWMLAGGDASNQTRGRQFFGRVDARMKTQRLPRVFTAPASALPLRWAYLERFVDGVHEGAVIDRSDGGTFQRDLLRVVEREAEP